jgi:hypothetical protein
MHSGATEGEARGVVAGDELMPRTRMVSTRVVEVEAPPSAIWPWLVRMGPGRGGASHRPLTIQPLHAHCVTRYRDLSP